MRARSCIIAVIGLGLIASVACSRNANQANFIGESCKAEADCPPELLCVNNACWSPCRPDNTCPNPGETCILGACVPGGGGGSQDASGPPGSGADSGTGPDDANNTQPIESDGTPVITGLQLPAQGGVGSFTILADDTRVFARNSEDTGLGLTTKIVASTLGTTAPAMWAPQPVSDLQNDGGLFFAANGSIYWTDSGPGSAGTIMRRAGDLLSATVSTPSTAYGNAGGSTSSVIDGKDIAFIDGSNQVRLFDTSTNTPDATVYGSAQAGMGPAVAKNGSKIMWLSRNGGNPIKIFAATQGGGAGADTGSTIPATAQIAVMQVIGTKLYFLTRTATVAAFEVETASPGTPVASIVPPGAGTGGFEPRNVFVVGNELIYAKIGGGAKRITKFNLTTKTETVGGKIAGDQLAITATAIYALEELPQAGPGGQTKEYRVAKFPR